MSECQQSLNLQEALQEQFHVEILQILVFCNIWFFILVIQIWILVSTRTIFKEKCKLESNQIIWRKWCSWDSWKAASNQQSTEILFLLKTKQMQCWKLRKHMSTNYRCDGVSISLISIGSNKTTQLFDVPQNHELYQLFRAWQAESARDKMQFFFSVINSGYIILEAEASWSTVRQQASCSKPIKSSWEVTSRLIIIWQQQTASKTALANGTAERRHSNSCCARHPRIRVASA